MLASIAKGLFGGGIQAIGNTIAKFTGDKVQQEANSHTENMAIHGSYAAENMQNRENRTMWDSFWDGLNRAPRPLFAFAVMALLAWPILGDPLKFSAAMTAFSLVPLWLGTIFGAVIGFYFTTRHLEKRLKMQGPSPEQVKAVVETQKAILSMRDSVPGGTKPDSEGGAVVPKEKNSAIEAWKKTVVKDEKEEEDDQSSSDSFDERG